VLLIWYCKRKSLYIFLVVLLFFFFFKWQMYFFLVRLGGKWHRRAEKLKKRSTGSAFSFVWVGGWAGGRAGVRARVYVYVCACVCVCVCVCLCVYVCCLIVGGRNPFFPVFFFLRKHRQQKREESVADEDTIVIVCGLVVVCGVVVCGHQYEDTLVVVCFSSRTHSLFFSNTLGQRRQKKAGELVEAKNCTWSVFFCTCAPGPFFLKGRGREG
jgi:hypothetical protein